MPSSPSVLMSGVTNAHRCERMPPQPTRDVWGNEREAGLAGLMKEAGWRGIKVIQSYEMGRNVEEKKTDCGGMKECDGIRINKSEAGEMKV